MLVRSFSLIVSIGCSAATALSAAFAETEPKSVVHQSLKGPSEFESIGDQAERSRAIFAEIGKLLTHPRCMSCHPAGDHPLQGADHHEHMPRVWRSDAGNLGTHCAECHTDNNVTLREAATYHSIPGHPRWGLAPLSMAWEGKTIGDICRQLKDTNRNGGRDLARISHTTECFCEVGWDFPMLQRVGMPDCGAECAGWRSDVFWISVGQWVMPRYRRAAATRRQTGEARALAAVARRRAAPAHSSAAGQAEAMAIRTRRTEMRISAPIFRSLSLMVPQVASAKTVLARPMRRNAQIRT